MAASTGFPRGINGLEDLPNEILEKIISFCVVDSVPIVDPIGWQEDCHCTEWHSFLPKTHEMIRVRDKKTMEAKQAIREMKGWDASVDVRRTGISTSILGASRLCHEIGMKYLYGKNTLLFTDPERVACFCENFPYGASITQHVVLPIHVEQVDAAWGYKMSKWATTQPSATGPWRSRMLVEPRWLAQARDEEGLWMQCPFPALKTLEIRHTNCIQMEAVEEEQSLVVRETVPRAVVRGLKIRKGLQGLVDAGWQAEKVTFTGWEGITLERPIRLPVFSPKVAVVEELVEEEMEMEGEQVVSEEDEEEGLGALVEELDMMDIEEDEDEMGVEVEDEVEALVDKFARMRLNNKRTRDMLE